VLKFAILTGMMLRRYTLAAAFLLLATGIAAAQIPDTFLESLEAGQTALVIEVVDGDTVVLSNGRQVRLVGIQAPKLPLGRPGFEKWPMADEAKQALSELVLGKNVTLAFGGQRVDRYNRLLAHLFTGDGGWVQGRLLERGLARVYSFTDNRALVKEMLNQEVASRMKRDGIWTSPYYAVLDPVASAAHLDRFALVEGRVLEAAQVRGRVFLNFGADYKTDFTISIAAKDWTLFDQAGIAPQDYTGRKVRVRGWLKSRNGPMIDVTHPEQIEVFSP
jgi:micrococcal nuclease